MGLFMKLHNKKCKKTLKTEIGLLRFLIVFCLKLFKKTSVQKTNCTAVDHTGVGSVNDVGLVCVEASSHHRARSSATTFNCSAAEL